MVLNNNVFFSAITRTQYCFIVAETRAPPIKCVFYILRLLLINILLLNRFGIAVADRLHRFRRRRLTV